MIIFTIFENSPNSSKVIKSFSDKEKAEKLCEELNSGERNAATEYTVSEVEIEDLE